ncbi:MAG: Gfo/Idh/MocA family oxidoreductase [Terriglobales bacterium]|jgi:predicted dehydrogenase
MKMILVMLAVFAVPAHGALDGSSGSRMKVGIVGLVHGHVAGFLAGSALTPAGGILDRPDVQLVGIVEPDQKLFDSYAARYHLPAGLHFGSIKEMVSQTHPRAVLVFTAPSEHRRVIEECAALGVHVMVEKPLTVSYQDALAIAGAAQHGAIHVLVDFETSWYASNTAAFGLLKQGALGAIVKTVIRDGHPGPRQIGVGPEFLSFLTDPTQNGAGALFDFGCYGPDLMTWLVDGEAPQSVTAVTKQLQPTLYPQVDDEAEIVLDYSHAVAIVQASWNWPFNVKQMDLYGRTGYAKAIDSERIEVRKANESEGQIVKAEKLTPPFDDPLHYMAAVLNREIEEGNSLSSLQTNVVVSEILDAARQSAQTGKTIRLPLNKAR